MMKKLFIPIVAGLLGIAVALPYAAEARRGDGRNQGGYCFRTGDHERQRLHRRDGSCLYAQAGRDGYGLKKGNRYGPGDGSGNYGAGPKDGTGYGAPSKK